MNDKNFLEIITPESDLESPAKTITLAAGEGEPFQTGDGISWHHEGREHAMLCVGTSFARPSPDDCIKLAKELARCVSFMRDKEQEGR